MKNESNKKRPQNTAFLRGGAKKRRDNQNAPARTGVKRERPQKQTSLSRSAKVPAYEEDRSEFVVVGKNPVREALNSELQIEKILVLKDNTDHVLKEIQEKAKKKKLIVQSVEKSQLEALADTLPHQGVAALLAPFPYADLDKTIEEASRDDNSFFVIIDHVTDPHNFGAIIRSANVCGAAGVIFPSRRSAGLSPTAVKASSGACAHTPLIKVTNLNQTIDKLKDQGYWIASADMDGEPYYRSNLTGKLAVIVGAEDGLSPVLKKKSDFILSIPVYGKVDSMNVSCASAVILAEAARQRHHQGK